MEAPITEEPDYGGFIMEISENDFVLGSDDIAVDLIRHERPDATIYQYNQKQGPETSNACTVFASSAAIDDLVNRQETYDDIKARWVRAISLGASPKRGWYFFQAVDLVRKEFNETSDRKVASFRLSNGPILKQALDYGYSLVAGYRGNAAYNADKNDGVLVGSDFPGWTYGHCVRIRKQGDMIVVVDNYSGLVEHNVYSIEHFDDLVKNGVFFNEFYLFMWSETITESQSKRLWAKAKGLWNGKWEDSFSTR